LIARVLAREGHPAHAQRALTAAVAVVRGHAGPHGWPAPGCADVRAVQ
jgi:hypothetical protein